MPDESPPPGAATPVPPERPPPPAKAKRTRVVRWEGLIPLALAVVLAVGAYHLFAEPVARDTLTDVTGDLLGTHVDIAAVELHETRPAVTLRGVQIADPFDSMKNLVEAQRLHLELEADPLLARRFVIRRLAIENVTVGTTRRTPAPPADPDGYAAQSLGAVRAWKQQFDVPLLRLTPIDTIRALVLDPTQLRTVQRALAVRALADSVRDTVLARYQALALRETLDSARETAERLRGANPLRLGITGTRQAVDDVRRTLESVRAAKRRVEALEQSARGGLDAIAAGARGVNDVKDADIAWAKGLLQLPTFDAPELGSAVFGPVAIDRFEDFVYWSELAERWIPPGLDPRRRPGPERLRASGTTFRFVSEQAWPTFWLRRGDLDLTVGGSGVASGTYRFAVANLTSAPALVGQPARFTLERSGGGTGVALRAYGVMDRRTATPLDSVLIAAAAIPLPSFDVPGLPLRASLGRGTSRIGFARAGDRIGGTWQLRSDDIAWRPDSARARALNRLESLAVRVIERLDSLEVNAAVSGSFADPSLRVRSNLDRLLADAIRDVVGEEVRRAEAEARRKVEALVRERAEPLRAEAERIRLDLEGRIAEAQARVDSARTDLEDRLRSLGIRPGG